MAASQSAFEDAYRYARGVVGRLVRDVDEFPDRTDRGRWTAGFWTGLLGLHYLERRDGRLLPEINQ